jgi:cytochrome c556
MYIEILNMKKVLITVAVFIGIVGINTVFAADEEAHDVNHHHEMSVMDMRTSLKLPGEMKQHQLSNMRKHLEAIKSIVGLIADNKFEEASEIAHAKLGFTKKMQAMCDMFDNEKFKTLGRAFHKSGDDLGDALQTKDMNASLHALNKMMQYCVECHAAYRQ